MAFSNKIELEIECVTSHRKLNLIDRLFTNKTPSYKIVLSDKEDKSRKILIIVGQAEAQAIAIELKKLKAPRPFLQDIIFELGSKLSLKFVDAEIYKMENLVYFSHVNFLDSSNQPFNLEIRTADAIILALKFNAPLYINSEIFNDNFEKAIIK